MAIDPPASGHQIATGDQWQSVDDKTLAQVIARYVMDVPTEDPETDEPVSVDYKTMLEKRGLILTRRQTEGGSIYHRLLVAT